MSERPSLANLSDIFLQIAEAPLDRREEMLLKLCVDEETRQKVCQLLAADDESDPLLDHDLFPEPIELKPGDRVSNYRLTKELAHGGMGIVYFAEQLEPIHRNVALKVIKPGVDTREVIARFNAERQTLSLMDHPNIASVFDAGSTDSGRPYFVMELVNGQPITTYCDQHRLTVRLRLEIFVSVCRAIQHAHQKGIIHRDIKPSNVLVGECDGQPVAKVIDFGVAKAINQTVASVTVATGLGQIVGTFDYMSPEQSRLNRQDVDTRSDIYSLGVLLYELLTDTPPFDRERLRSVDLDQMLKIIQQEDPPRPSTRLTEVRERLWCDSPTQFLDEQTGGVELASPDDRDAQPSRAIESQLRKRIRTVRGELDWIVMKALEKEPDRRYRTPDELAADIERFLEGEAVAACPPSAAYRLRKFARRNRTGLAISGLVVGLLLLSVGGGAFHLFRVSKARSDADVAALESFVEDLLGIDDSRTADGYSPDPNVTLLILLRNAEQRVDDRLANRPDIKAKMNGILARSFNSLGQYDEAIRLYRNYRDFLTANNGLSHPETIGVMERMVRLHIANAQLSEAKELTEDALRYSRTYLGDEHELTLQLLHDRAMLDFEEGKSEAAVKVYREVLEVRRRLIGDTHPETLDTMSQLAAVLDSLERYDEAIELYVGVVESCRTSLSANDARLASALQQLGRCYLVLGRRNARTPGFDEAANLLVESLEVYDRNRGPDHTDTLESQFLLSQVYAEQKQFEKALPLLEDLVNRLERLRDPGHLTTLEAANLLGWTYLRLSDLTEAEYVLTGAFEQLRQRFPNDPLRIQVMGNLAIAKFRLGKLESSVSIDEQILMLAPKVLGSDHRETAAAFARLGFAYLDLGQTADAKRRLEQAYQSNKGFPGATSLLKAIERCEAMMAPNGV